MIVVYTSPGCASCRKVKNWLKDHELRFIEKNIFHTALNESEIKHLLMRSENGTEDIISKRSKVIQENQIDVEEVDLAKENIRNISSKSWNENPSSNMDKFIEKIETIK